MLLHNMKMLLRSLKNFTQWRSTQVNTILAAIAAQSINISVGLCQGYSAVLLPQLTDDLDTSPEQASWIASMGVISNPIGALIGGLLQDAIGRKLLLQSIVVPNLAGWIVIAFSENYIELCVGRFITGLTIGLASACYIYVAEVTLPSNRSMLSALGPALVSLGILIVYILGAYVHWKKVASICAAVSLITPFLMHWVPESPLWLFSKGRRNSALMSLAWLRHSESAAEDEIKIHEKEHSLESAENADGARSRFRLLASRIVVVPFFILLFFFMFQELSGIYVILYYSVDFFREANTNLNEYTASIVVGVLRLVMAVIGTYLINRYRRKSLSVASGTLLGFTMLGAAVIHTIGGYPTLKLVCILLHVCASMIGFLQIPWIMSSELYPQRIRGSMAGITASCGYLLVFVNIKTYPALQELLTYNGALYLFSSFGFLGAAYCLAFLPETQGKSLTEISNSFRKNAKIDDDLEKDVQVKRVEAVRF